MVRNYFIIAWRNLVKNKLDSIINIGGLSVGMAVAILIGLWVYDEMSFDKYYKNYGRIAEISSSSTDPATGAVNAGQYVQIPMAAALKDNYQPYFKHVLLAADAADYTLSAGDKKLPKRGEFIEAGAPDMLSLNAERQLCSNE